MYSGNIVNLYGCGYKGINRVMARIALYYIYNMYVMTLKKINKRKSTKLLTFHQKYSQANEILLFNHV